MGMADAMSGDEGINRIAAAPTSRELTLVGGGTGGSPLWRGDRRLGDRDRGDRDLEEDDVEAGDPGGGVGSAVRHPMSLVSALTSAGVSERPQQPAQARLAPGAMRREHGRLAGAGPAQHMSRGAAAWAAAPREAAVGTAAGEVAVGAAPAAMHEGGGAPRSASHMRLAASAGLADQHVARSDGAHTTHAESCCHSTASSPPAPLTSPPSPIVASTPPTSMRAATSSDTSPPAADEPPPVGGLVGCGLGCGGLVAGGVLIHSHSV